MKVSESKCVWLWFAEVKRSPLKLFDFILLFQSMSASPGRPLGYHEAAATTENPRSLFVAIRGLGLHHTTCTGERTFTGKTRWNSDRKDGKVKISLTLDGLIYHLMVGLGFVLVVSVAPNLYVMYRDNKVNGNQRTLH